ncbi:MAG: tRNA pseudouridine(38-40) synthase TruA [Bacteroidetes bacterium 4572_77]|nr:MAG: tRNA pseudouridine(38-40) synthase TruA [Bacteroidetes bacterium 4572_77]
MQETKRYFLKLSYLGSNYHGWQIQPNAISVQEKLQDVFSLLFKNTISITGCGRTDTGVHAREFFAHADLDFKQLSFPKEQLIYKLNAILPPDIAIQDIKEVAKNAHSRFDALSRTYEYHLSESKKPFSQGLYYHSAYKNLDFDLMNQAAKILLEYQDFECFSKTGTDVATFNCHIKYAQWTFKNNMWVFTITADRFLRNMVRAIVGTLIEIGRKNKSLEDMKTIIESKNRGNAGWSVPGKGLFLTEIKY